MADTKSVAAARPTTCSFHRTLVALKYELVYTGTPRSRTTEQKKFSRTRTHLVSE
jgi:hypothetical protein